MGFLNKMVSVPTALGKRNKFNKPSIMVTTNDYMYNKPVYSRELMAKQSTDINMSVFSRLYPMQNPAYARAKFVNRAFFVPYRTIFPEFDRFLSQEKARNGAQVTRVHSLNQMVIFQMFVQDSDLVSAGPYQGKKFFCERVPWTYPNQPSENDYDIAYFNYVEDDDPSTAVFMKLTKRGKVVFDTLINLGYNIPKFYSVTPDYYLEDENMWNIPFSALPLLAYAKIWFDWYRNNKYEPLYGSQYIEAFFNLQSPQSFTKDNLASLLLFISQISYPLDYFTAASQNPVTPSIGEPAQTVQDITLSGMASNAKSEVTTNNNVASNTPYIRRTDGQSSAATSVTQYILNFLNKMTDYMQRDGLVGGKTLDRLLAHYGVRMPDEKLRRSVYLGKYEQDLVIMDVTQTSPQTTGPDSDPTSVLGYQAGRGQTGNRQVGHFQYDTDEFGQLIIISQLVPEVSYYQGVKREMMHLNRFDFFTPEYDSLGPQAINVAEVFNGVMDFETNRDNWLWWNNAYSDVFGYVPSRYFEYKQSTSQDVLSGDFRVATRGAYQLRSYHQFRQLRDLNFDNHKVRTSLKFDSCMADVAQFDRIFNSQDSGLDHFLSFYNFEVVDYMPCRPAFEGYDFGDDEEHRIRVNVAKNGTQF